MDIVCHHPQLEAYVLGDELTNPAAFRDLLVQLGQWGTLDFHSRPSGLFSAVADGGRNPHSGYQRAWLRDNVHIAHARWRGGDPLAALRCLEALLSFQKKTKARFEDCIAGRADATDPQQRPHVRFASDSLEEVDQRWAHAQNDAVAYVLWLAASMWKEGEFAPRDEDLELFALHVAYYRAIEFTSDEDSGHWEEARRVKSSSIGVVTAALDVLLEAIAAEGLRELRVANERIPRGEIETLAGEGRRALEKRLPAESPGDRDSDAALLFLLTPLDLLEGPLAEVVLNSVLTDLMGDYGIKRYVGDSYWCGDYRRLLPEEQLSSDYSDDTRERDRLLRPGEEAQWCIFDPVLAIEYGHRHRRSGDPEDRRRQIRHLRRALGQITGPGEWCPEGLCPEAWYLQSRDEGVYRPNDQTPLGWTQANLGWALANFAPTLS
jgi:phosphorylase kinase alpha/beta subunit